MVAGNVGGNPQEHEARGAVRIRYRVKRGGIVSAQIPGTTCLFASPEIGAAPSTIPVLGCDPLELTARKPPGIPPLPPMPADATSALLAKNVTVPC